MALGQPEVLRREIKYMQRRLTVFRSVQRLDHAICDFAPIVSLPHQVRPPANQKVIKRTNGLRRKEANPLKEPRIAQLFRHAINLDLGPKDAAKAGRVRAAK